MKAAGRTDCPPAGGHSAASPEWGGSAGRAGIVGKVEGSEEGKSYALKRLFMMLPVGKELANALEGKSTGHCTWIEPACEPVLDRVSPTVLFVFAMKLAE